MRTVCSFPGCKSGTAKVREYNKMNGVRNLTLFKFPKKDTSLRKQWEEVIGRQAKDTEVLCELHFWKNDVKKHYETTLSDGSKCIMTRGRISLESTAVPQLIACNVKQSDQQFNLLFKAPAQSVKNDSGFSLENENYNFESTEPNEAYTTETFTLERFNEELKLTQLPKGWAHMLLEDFLIVCHWTPTTPARREFHVNHDGTTEVFFDGHGVSLLDMKPCISVDNLVYNIKLVQSLLSCDGTGVDNRYSQVCRKYIKPLKSQIRNGHMRCFACQILRKKIIREESRRRNLQDRQKRTIKAMKSTIKNLKCKNDRLKKKVDKYKAEIVKAHKKCATANRTAIEETVSNLPLEQQEAVQACFTSAKIKQESQEYSSGFVSVFLWE